MLKLKKVLFTGIFLFLAIGTGYSQSSTDAELLENARNEVQNLSEELDVNKDKEVLLVRAIYSYNKRKMQLEESDELDTSEKSESLEDANASFRDNIKHALEDDEQLTKRFFELYSED